MERQTARDTTTGQPLPMGQRQAFVADTVAAGSNAPGGTERKQPVQREIERLSISELQRQIEETRRVL